MEENIPYLKHEGNQFSGVSSKETFDLRSALEVGLGDEGRGAGRYWGSVRAKSSHRHREKNQAHVEAPPSGL